MAYLGKLMSELHVKKQENLKDCSLPFDNKNNYQKVVRYADDKLKTELIDCIEYIKERNRVASLDRKYNNAITAMNSATTEEKYKSAARLFEEISEYKNSVSLAQKCNKKAKLARLDEIYIQAKAIMNGAYTEIKYKEAARLFESISQYKDSAILSQECYDKAAIAKKDELLANGKSKMRMHVDFEYEKAISIFKLIPGWKDADELQQVCRTKIEEIKAKEAERLEEERLAELERREKERIKNRNEIIRKILALSAVAVICVVFILLWNFVISPMIQKSQYNKAESLFANKDYYEAIQIYGQLGEYKDSSEKILEAKYQYIMKYPDAENTYIYLSELMNMDYKNSHSLYDSYYELKVNICANNSDKYDGDLHKTNFKLYNPIYFHIFLSGGDPNKDYEEYNLNYKISGPGGNSYSRKLYGYDEEIITWYYTIESGPVTIRVYCDDKLLAESTVYYVDED